MRHGILENDKVENWWQKREQIRIVFLVFCCLVAFFPFSLSFAQGSFSGSFQLDAQRYSEDKVVNYSALENKYGANTYFNLRYEYKNFRVGTRIEGYTPALIGYPSNLHGVGLAHKFVAYKNKNYEFVLGNFYEQFGNGIALRFQEQRPLGMDTSLDGFLAKNENKFSKTKMLIGKQRLGFHHAEGLLMGIDEEIALHKVLKWQKKLNAGISFVNKRESYNGILATIKPNVFVWATRANFQHKNLNISTEYAQKSTDPNASNRFVAGKGSAWFFTTHYNLSNWAFALMAKRIENMDYRSQRGETQNNALVNYIPNTTKQHSYRLQNLYPYSSQVNGEIGGQVDAIYTYDDGGILSLNYAILNGLNKQKYYRDFSFEYEKEWTEKWKTIFSGAYVAFNKEVILGGSPEIVKSLSFVVDATYKMDKRKAFRFELQHLATKQDKGNWAMALAELSISPRYFFFASDEINYKDLSFPKAIHYYNGGFAIKHKSHRLSVSYGRVREGLLCVGGICRIVPAYKGLSVSLVSSF